MSEIEWQPGVGLVLPERVTFAAADSTYTTQNAIAGVPVPQNKSGMVVTATGDAPSAEFELRTQTGGHAGVDGRATFVWREVGGATWYGFDGIGSVYDVLPLTGSYQVNTSAARPADAIGLADGAGLCVLYREQTELGPSTHFMASRRIEPDGTVTPGTVFEWPDDPTGDHNGIQAALCQLQNGRVLMFTAVYDAGSETTQVRTDYSDDGGLTWSNATTAALPTALPNASSDYVIFRMSAAATDSTVALLVTVVRPVSAVETYRDVCIQYASRDGGSNFAEVFRTDETTSITGLKQMADACIVATASNNLVAIWVAEDGFAYRRLLGSPYDAIGAEPPVIVDSLLAIAAAATAAKSGSLCALTAREDGGLVFYAVTITSYGFAFRLAVSLDGGATFEPASVGEGGLGLFGEVGSTLGMLPAIPRLFPLAGRIGFLHTRSLGDFDASVAFLGKTSDITLPPYYTGARSNQQVAWRRVWWGYEPSDFAHVAELPAVPTATGSYTDDGWQIAGSPGTLYYQEDMTADETAADIYDIGMIRRYTVAVTVGGSLTADQAAVRFRLGKGSGTSQDISIRHTTTGFRVYDNIATAAIGTDVSGLTAGAEIEVMVHAIAGDWRVWYRLRTFSGETRWTLSHTFTPSTSALAAVAWAQWGNIASSTTTSRWRYAGAAYGPWVGTGLPDTIANPLDLTGRPWSPRAVTVPDTGTKIRAVGVTVRGDQWRVAEDSDVRVTNAFRGGPRVGWEASGDTAQTLLFDLSSHNAITSGDILVVSGFGSNVGYVQIIGVAESGAETTLFDGALTAGVDGLHFTCNGDRVRPETSTQGSNRPTFAADELTGSQWSHYSGGAWRSFRIVNNREGKWTNATTARAAIFVDGALPTAGSGTDGRIVPRDWAVHVSMRGAEYERVKIVIPAPNTTTIPGPAGGRWKIGRLHIGYATAYVYLPSWGNRVTYEPVEEVVEARDGQRTGLELAPTRRRMTVGWVDGTSMYDFAQRTAGRYDGSPRYFRVDSGADPVGLAGMEQMSLAGVLRRTRGAREMVYLTDMQPAQTFVYNRHGQLALCYLDSDVAYERFAGRNMVGDAVRGDVVELVEAT